MLMRMPFSNSAILSDLNISLPSLTLNKDLDFIVRTPATTSHTKGYNHSQNLRADLSDYLFS